MSEKKIIVRQVRSAIGRSESFRRILDSLGLGRIGNKKTFKDSPAVRGMLEKVSHVVQIGEV